MIQFLPCPGCSRHLVLPAGVSQEALIQCPCCEKEIVLGEALASQFGTWVVINDPAAVVDPVSLAVTATPSDADSTFDPVEQPVYRDTTQAYGDTTHETYRDETYGDTPVTAETATAESDNPLELGDSPRHGVHQASQSTSDASKTELNWSEFKSITRDQTQRMNRKSASPFWSLIQIVLGGLAAVPIALLLLWWVLGKDVAGAGPIVGEYLPWIVPEAFRPIDESSAVARRRQLLIPPASGLPQLSDASIDQDVAAADPLEPPVSPSLLAQISDCRRALDEWRVVAQSGEGDLKPIARSIYGSLTEMATMVNDLSTETSVAPSVCSALQPVALDIKQNPDLQSVVRQGAVYWLEKNSAAGEFPLAAVLELGEVVELPESWMVTAPTTKAWPPSIEAILIPQSLAPSPTPGQKLFLLGKVTKRTDVATEQAPNVRSLVAAYLYDL